jgi:hypothetical protein
VGLSAELASHGKIRYRLLYAVGHARFGVGSDSPDNEQVESCRTALLIDGFRRQCTMLELRIPRKPDNPTEAECPDHLLRSVRRKDDVGVRTDFLRDHSMFIHAILEMGRTLTRLEEVEPVAASMLRMELFMTIKRDHFKKYEEICIALVSPNDYKKVCE